MTIVSKRKSLEMEKRALGKKLHYHLEAIEELKTEIEIIKKKLETKEQQNEGRETTEACAS